MLNAVVDGDPEDAKHKMARVLCGFLKLNRQVLSHKTSSLLSFGGSAAFSGPYDHQSGMLSYIPNGSTELPPLQPRIPSAHSESRGIRLKAGGGVPYPLGRPV